MQVMYILDVSFHDISPSKYPELVFKTSEESPVLMTISISLRLNGKGWFRRSIHPTCLRTNFPPYVRVGSRYHFPSHGLGLLTSRERWWNRMNSFQTDLFTETTPLVSSRHFKMEPLLAQSKNPEKNFSKWVNFEDQNEIHLATNTGSNFLIFHWSICPRWFLEHHISGSELPPNSGI